MQLDVILAETLIFIKNKSLIAIERVPRLV